MKRLVIDIETVGTPWEEHDPYVREYLIKGMNDAEAEEEKRRGALSPFTGHIITIGVMNVDTRQMAAYYEVPGQDELRTRRDGNRTYLFGSERHILEAFWQHFGRDDRFITFNGRQFDGPFLMIRSAILGVQPKRDLIGYRYKFHPNCDLREVLNFTGTVYSRQMRFNLDLACKAFGIESSKHEGMDGRAVETYYRDGMVQEIADYCLEDVRATAELYERLAPTILVWNADFRRSEEAHPPAKHEAETDESHDRLPSEEEFIESVRETSESLVASVDEVEAEKDSAALIGEKQQASVLGKLIGGDRDDDSDDEETPPLARFDR